MRSRVLTVRAARTSSDGTGLDVWKWNLVFHRLCTRAASAASSTSEHMATSSVTMPRETVLLRSRYDGLGSTLRDLIGLGGRSWYEWVEVGWGWST